MHASQFCLILKLEMQNLSKKMAMLLQGFQDVVFNCSTLGTNEKADNCIDIFKGYSFECAFFGKVSRNFGSGLCC
jgi:hypothetical protein